MKVKFTHTRLHRLARIVCSYLTALFLLVGAGSASATIIVSFESDRTSVGLHEQFSVNLWADIPAADPVIGWGLDLLLDETVFALRSVTLGNIWLGFPTPDLDGLGGLSFSGIHGRTLLAVLQLEAVGVGSSLLSIGTTSGDFTEGFALRSPGKFANYDVNTSRITVAEVSAPLSLPLFGLGVALLGFARKRVVKREAEAAV